jgi:alpha-tubulin suppressor-like RCC1 family protein
MKLLPSSVAVLSALLLPAAHLQAMPTVSAGGAHSCAIRDGNLYCWGANYNGQIGNGGKAAALRPVRIAHPQNYAWIGVSAGYAHTCAVDDTLAAYCWGSNAKGQLGNGTLDDSLTPSPVLNPDDLKPFGKVRDISVGNGSCAISDGKIACWGPNDDGQLGNNSTSPSTLPVLLSNPVGVTSIAGGVLHACATTGGSELYCWGWNYFGQLGDGTKNNSGVPLHVLDQVLNVTVTESVSCAIGHARLTGNRLLCWVKIITGNSETTATRIQWALLSYLRQVERAH